MTTETRITTAKATADWLDHDIRTRVARIEQLRDQFMSQYQAATSHLEQVILYAHGIKVLREALTPDLVHLLSQLQNYDFGFQTDRPSGYDAAVVKNVIIDAILNGVWPLHNEINIISGHMFITHIGWKRKIAELPGMDQPPHIFEYDKPTSANFDGMRFHVSTTYVWHGREQTFKTVVTVKANKGMNVDNLDSRIQRKVLKQLYHHLTSSQIYLSLEDEDDVDGRAKALAELEAAKDRAKLAGKLNKDQFVELLRKNNIKSLLDATEAQLLAAVNDINALYPAAGGDPTSDVATTSDI